MKSMKRSMSKKMNTDIHSPKESGNERYITVARRKQYFSEAAIIRSIGAALLMYQIYVLNPEKKVSKAALALVLAKILYFLISSGVWIAYYDKTRLSRKSERYMIKKRRLWLFVGAFISLLAYLGVSASKFMIKDSKYGRIPKNYSITKNTPDAEDYAMMYAALFAAL